MDPSVLQRKPLTELKQIASELQLRGYQRLRKAELVEAIVARAGEVETLPGLGDEQASGHGNGHAAQPASDGHGETSQPQSHGNGAEAAAARGGSDAPDDAPDQEQPVEQRTETEQREEHSQAEGAGDGQHDEGDDGEQGQGVARTRRRTRERQRSGEDDARDGGADGDSRATHGEHGGADADAAPQQAPAEAQQRDGGGQDHQQRDGDGQDGRPDKPQGQQDKQQGQQDKQQGQQDKQDKQQGQQGQQGQDSDEEGQRRRRNRRERKRGKGNKGQQGQQQEQQVELGEVRSGVLDILPEGYGFTRAEGYLPGDKDAYLSQGLIRRHNLRRGDVVEGPIRANQKGDKVPAMHYVQSVNGLAPDEQGNLPHRPSFKDMTPLFPEERLPLETPDGPISMRIVDLIAPIGKGQRGLIVSPPKAGKTTILKELGQAIAYNNPEVHLMVVLVDERPEEVTDMRRSIPGEVVASTFDRPADDHTQIAELVMERAKRVVEGGGDVVVLLDSITRLARAYNLAAPASGRIMSGGVDSSALYPPKRFFGAARNIEGGGSLSVLATALVETGSKMDEVIFEEFKGTGNMELRLDRKLEQKRVFPAIAIDQSGTRKEELLMDREELQITWKLRRVLSALDGPAALELLIDKMKQTKGNNQFLVQIQKSNLQT